MTETADFLRGADQLHGISKAMKFMAGIAIFLLERAVIKFAAQFFIIVGMAIEAFFFILGHNWYG